MPFDGKKALVVTPSFRTMKSTLALFAFRHEGWYQIHGSVGIHGTSVRLLGIPVTRLIVAYGSNSKDPYFSVIIAARVSGKQCPKLTHWMEQFNTGSPCICGRVPQDAHHALLHTEQEVHVSTESTIAGEYEVLEDAFAAEQKLFDTLLVQHAEETKLVH
ncbi:hypothetical protein KTR10_00550 [Candidatus Kaiserbacteria bacterium]|nr:hypothetical protein [Candidatus Kaiserbacteria bacterium]